MGGGALDKDPLVPKARWQEARAKPLHSLPAVPGCQAVWVEGESYSWNPLPLCLIPCFYTRPPVKSLPQQLPACLEPSFLYECRTLTLAHSGPNQQKTSHINSQPCQKPPPPQLPPVMTEPHIFTGTVSIKRLISSLRQQEG